MRRLRRLTAFLLTVAMLAAVSVSPAAAEEAAAGVNTSGLKAQLKIDSEWQTYDMILYTVERANYQILAPARPFMTALGAEVEWDAENSRVTCTKGDNSAVITIGSNTALKNGAETELPTAAQLVNDTAYIPVEFCGDALGYHVLRETFGRVVRLVTKTTTESTKYNGELKPGMAPLVSTVHRPVQTEFEKSNRLDDLIFYQEHEYVPKEQLIKEKNEAIDYDNLPSGEVVYTMEDILESTPEGKNVNGWWKEVTVDDESVPFKKALRISCTYIPANSVDYIVKPSKRIEEYVDPADKYLIKVYVRLAAGGNVDTGLGKLYMHVEEDYKSSWEKSVSATMEFNGDWHTFYYVSTGVENSNHIGFTTGFNLQTIDIGGFEVQKLSRDADVSMFQKANAEIDYMEPELSRDAPWRKEALDRIEKVRKGDFKVVVRDKDGNPVPDADVRFDMFEHEFKFGVMLDADSWQPNEGGVVAKDMANIAACFNSVGCGNAQKLGQFDSNRQISRRILDDAKSQGIKYFRGHAIWMPILQRGDIRPYRFYGNNQVEDMDWATFEKYVKEHINKIAATEPEVYEWDVTNEMVNRVTFDKFGKTKYMKKIFDWCREILPEGTDLALCDNNLRNVRYWEILDDFQEMNADYDVLTIQNHCTVETKTGITDMLRFYDRYTYEYQKQFSITEFSMYNYENTEEGRLRGGDMVRDFLIAVFSHPGANAFTCFWLSDAYSGWQTYQAPLFDEKFKPKPAWYQWNDLLYNKWWTRDAHTTTDKDGRGSVKGFYGDYDVTVSVGGKEVKSTMAAFHRGYENELTINLD